METNNQQLSTEQIQQQIAQLKERIRHIKLQNAQAKQRIFRNRFVGILYD